MLSPGIRSTIVVIFKGIFVASSEIFPECLKGFFFFFFCEITEWFYKACPAICTLSLFLMSASLLIFLSVVQCF